MRKRGVFFAWTLILFLFVGCVAVLLNWRGATGDGGDTQNYNLYEMPVLEISLNEANLLQIQEGSKETKYGGNVAAFYNGNEVSYFDDVTVKGRGNSTWKLAKKPYQIDLNQKTNLLNLGKNSKWVLLANYLDGSHLRNDLALYLARMLGEDFALNGEPVELTIDGENLGLYFLTPKIKIGKNSVDLRDEMGVIMELDNLNADCETEICYYSADGNTLTIKGAVNEEKTEAVVSDFMQNYNELEVAAARGDFEKVKELIDVESFAQYFLVNEFSNNPDAYSTSWFMYKDGTDDKIHAGPAWDFDLAFGNALWGWDNAVIEDGYYPDKDLVRRTEAFGGTYCNEDQCREVAEDKGISKLVYYLLEMPEFYEEVKRVYQEKMAGHKSETLAYLKRRADEIYVAAVEDNAQWERVNFEEAVEYLCDWVVRRYNHFDLVYGDGNVEKVLQEL
jgi:spore coat protein CotH